METSAERGRREFFAIIGAATLLLLAIALLASRRRADFHPVTEFGRLAVFLGLAYLAYGGARWARILVALWIGFLAVAVMVGAINAAMGSALGLFLGLAFASAMVYAAYLLLRSKAIDSFLAGRKSKQVASPPAA